MAKRNIRKAAWERRQSRVRKKVLGTAECPRLNVFRSSRHMYAQIIDDVNRVTLATASTLSSEIKGQDNEEGGKVNPAKSVGELIAAKAKDKGIETVVFDRNGFLYHGRVAAVAEGARAGGLKF